MKYACFVSTYNKIYGTVKLSKNDKYRDVFWDTGVWPKKSRIKKNQYRLYEWI